jgi:broad specificity phosphatase PhoE
MMTSYLKRAIKTAESIKLEKFELKQYRELSEIDAGICEGLTYSELE